MLNQQGRFPLEQARPNFRLLPKKTQESVTTCFSDGAKRAASRVCSPLFPPRDDVSPISFLSPPPLSPFFLLSNSIFSFEVLSRAQCKKWRDRCSWDPSPPLSFPVLYWGEALKQLGTAPKFPTPDPQRGEIFTVAILGLPAVPSNEAYSSKRRLVLGETFC